MFKFETEQKVCEVGGVKFGGQPGEYPTAVCASIFQKGDKVFTGKRKEGFDEKRAEELLKTQDRLTEETGIPGMADIVANTGQEFETFIDFVASASDMPFCIDAWVMKPKLAGAAYCAEKGLLDRMFYNSLTVWEKDLETEIREISQIGVKHVLLVAFDQEDQLPSGRITGTQKLLDAIEKVGAEFESIFVDTSVMNGPATAFCGIANRMIKEKWGFPEMGISRGQCAKQRLLYVEKSPGVMGFQRLGCCRCRPGGSFCFHVPRHDILRAHGRSNKDLSGRSDGRRLFGHRSVRRDKGISQRSKSPVV
jgi:tetrahydromethanopterin S-methyltransferase subunit H